MPGSGSVKTVGVPAHWRLEVCNSLWMAERRKRLDATGVTQAADLFLKIPVAIDPDTNERAGRETLALARQHGLSVYDAAYLKDSSKLRTVCTNLPPLQAAGFPSAPFARPSRKR